MANSKDIEKYIEKVFDLYNMDKEGFFYEMSYDGKDFVEGRKYEISLFPTDEVDEATLNKVSTALGLSKDEIISMDNGACFRYWDKYPFFRLYAEYLDRIYWSSNFSGEYLNPEERLLTAIFSDEDEPLGNRNYDHNDVIKRLLNTLKEADSFMPGTYHANAYLKSVEIGNCFFFSFPDCQSMICSFFDMVSQLQYYFFKSLDGELSTEEINEMNFLATWLGAVDSFIPSSIITYDFVKKLSKAYKSEGDKDFFHYVKIKNFITTKPWQCMEFFDDKNLVQQFVNIFPEAKYMMRDFSMAVKNYSCVYEWSDAKPIVYDPETDSDLIYLDQVMGLDKIPIEDRPKERDHLYIPKNQDEMMGWEKSLSILKDVISPPSLGGLIVPKRDYFNLSDSEDFSIFINRFNAQRGVADNG